MSGHGLCLQVVCSCGRKISQGYWYIVSHGAAGTGDRQRVLDATDIVRLVGEHLTLKAKGREFVCLCPFHDDHKPSMYVVPHKQIYHCFSCGAGGNAIDFVVEYHKLPFREALKFLADRAGIELTPFKPGGSGAKAQQAYGPSRETLSGLTAFACEFFRMMYAHEEHGRSAREVVRDRGISEEMVERFALGASPDRWDGLLQTARGKSMGDDELLAAGLIKQPEPGKTYDTFRKRLMFPIHDQLGRVIAFGGRILDPEDKPKYLNSPETALFDKSSTLYGLYQASRAIQRERCAIVVEGYTDVIACHQAGIDNVVGTLGTALTSKHASILRRLCDRVVLLFDADVAGAKAADRALEVFFRQPIDVSIAVLPEGADPADVLARDGGGDVFRACVGDSIDALEYRFERLGGALGGLGDAARSRKIEEELARLSELGLHSLEPIRKRMVVQRLAELAGVDIETIQASMPGAARRRGAGEASAEGADDAGLVHPTIAEQALGCLLAVPELIDSLLDEDVALLSPSWIEEGPARQIAQAIQTTPSGRSAEHSLEDAAARRLAIDLTRRIQWVCDDDERRIEAHLRDCLKNLARVAREKITDSGMDSPGLDANNPVRSSCDESLRRIAVLQRQHIDLGGDLSTLPKPVVTAHRVQARVGVVAQGGEPAGVVPPPSDEAGEGLSSSSDHLPTDPSGESNS